MRWLPVRGWEGRYEVSDTGRVRTALHAVCGLDPQGRPCVVVRQPMPVRQQRNRRGHRRVMLTAGWSRRHAYVHALVAEAFIGPRPPGMLVCHRDDRKGNNAAGNLYYGTRLDNAADALRNGGYAAGVRRRA